MSPDDRINIDTNSNAVPIVTSHPDKIQRHNISDEELDMLCEAKTHFALEILLISLGGIIGTLPAVIPAIQKYNSSVTNSIELPDLIQVILFFVCLCVCLSTGVIYYRKSKGSRSLRDRIRDRTKQNDGFT